MKILSLAGPSDAGKTTLVESLVPRLADRGRVATVKSIHHDVEVDDPGTDTYRHKAAGAGRVVGITPGTAFSVGDGGKAAAPSEPAALAAVLDDLADDGFDYAVVEGFAAAAVPVVLVGDAPAEVGGPVVARADAHSGRDPDRILDAVESLPDHETHRSLRADLAAGGPAVATLVAALPGATPDTGLGEFAADGPADRCGLRPAVVPGDPPVVHLGVAAETADEALAVVRAARDHLAGRLGPLRGDVCLRDLVGGPDDG